MSAFRASIGFTILSAATMLVAMPASAATFLPATPFARPNLPPHFTADQPKATGSNPWNPAPHQGHGAHQTTRPGIDGLPPFMVPDFQPPRSPAPLQPPAELARIATPPAIPEPSTWMLMIGSFALIGFSLRRREDAAEAET